MPLTNTGRDFIADAIFNNGPPTFYDNSNAELAVGTDTTTFNKTQTALIATGVNETRQGMETGYPQAGTAANIIKFRSLFGTAVANHIWGEWGVFNHSTAGTMLSRKVDALGTKSAAQSWQLTVDITVNNP